MYTISFYFLTDLKNVNFSPCLATLTSTCIPKYTLYIRQKKTESRNLYLLGTDLSDPCILHGKENKHPLKNLGAIHR